MNLKSVSKLSLCALMISLAYSAHAQPVARSPYIVQLVDAPVAAYEGGVGRLSATRPGIGQRLDMTSARVQAYSAFLRTRVNTVTAKVPAAAVYQRFGVVLTGFAAMLSPDELNALRLDPSVKAITADEPMSLGTSYTTAQFLKLAAAGGAWSRKDSLGRDIKGEDVIIGIIDTGVWPENRSVSDKVGGDGKPVPYFDPAGTVVYSALPAGRFRGICQVGEGFTAAMCNNKLIGAQVFNATFKTVNVGKIWPGEYDSPRDEDGHGSHTMTTAGGNANSLVTVGGSDFEATGVAPRARLAAYKVCNAFINASNLRQNGCYTGDTVQAYEKAVADGVDVINFSISGSNNAVNGAVAQAMLGAAKANVFVAASAGNSGPTSAGPANVAHISPWVATVGNSTHDRYTEAVVTLNTSPTATTAQGPSWQTAGLGATTLVWSRLAGAGAAAAAQGSNQALCYGAADGVAALLDPAKVAGKIIVCDRGGNVLVNKVTNAKAAGALGVIIQNTPVSNNSTPLIAADLPTVHLPASAFTAVTTQATANGTASFGAAFQVAGVVAPVMAGSSSRGPNQFDPNVLKPDITGPGTDIIAAYTAAGVTLAERADIIAGTANGRQGAGLLTGTSMSSPHVAGAAALLRQQNPTWSVAAIKSALMTSAEQTVKLASGAPDLGVTNPNQTTVNAGAFGFGAGHLAPNPSLSTQLVYDITNAQFDAYSAGTIGTGLNLASITFSNVLGVASTTRTLRNMGSTPLTLTATASVPGFTVAVSPSGFTIPAGGSQSFTVALTRTTAAFGSYLYGNLTVSGGGQTLRSPLTARASAAVVNASFADTRTTGTRITTIGTGFSGPTATTSSGMVPATRTSGSVAVGGEVCVAMVVPAGAWAIRAQLYNSDTQGGAATDLDLAFRPATGTTVLASSGLDESNEVVNLTSPAAGTYRACVTGFASAVSTTPTFTLSTWIVPNPSGVQTLRAAGPSAAVVGGTASLVSSWTAPVGARSLGAVRLSQTGGPALTQSLIYVDALSAPTALAAAPVLRNKPQPLAD